jgi:hypothetical protein
MSSYHIEKKDIIVDKIENSVLETSKAINVDVTNELYVNSIPFEANIDLLKTPCNLLSAEIITFE